MTNEVIQETPLETPAEIARIINTTSQTVLNYFHAGIIPAEIAIGRLIRFKREDVLAALKNRTLEGAQ